MTTQKTKQQINKAYQVAKTWEDADKIIASMTTEQVIELRNALETTKEYTGLDMRQDFFLTLLRSEVDKRASKKEAN